MEKATGKGKGGERTHSEGRDANWKEFSWGAALTDIGESGKIEKKSVLKGSLSNEKKAFLLPWISSLIPLRKFLSTFLVNIYRKFPEMIQRVSISPHLTSQVYHLS